ncbi:MAG: autotransporter domain-containing protein [Gammaproteobacteria bacterium]|jgi:uncharacterized protein with beta-barrel porin domain
MPRKARFSKAITAYLIGQLAVFSVGWATTDIDSTYVADSSSTSITNGAVFNQSGGTLQVGDSNGVVGTVSNSGSLGSVAVSSSGTTGSSAAITVNSGSSITTVNGNNVIDFSTISPSNACVLTINNSGTIANQNPAGTNNFVGNAISGDTSGKTSLQLTNGNNSYIYGAITMGNNASNSTTNANLITNSGEIQGAINLGNGLTPNTITNSGFIDGNITTGNGDILNNNGGYIQGNINLGVGGTINLTNTNAIEGIITGGTGDTTSILNVGGITGLTARFTTGGLISNIGNINVNSVGTTFNVNSNISGINTLTAAAGTTTTISGAGIEATIGTVTNSGTIVLGSSSDSSGTTVTGNFTNGGTVSIQNPNTTIDGVYRSNTEGSIHIANINNGVSAQLTIGSSGRVDLSNSTVQVVTSGNTVLTNGQILDIIVGGNTAPNLMNTTITGSSPALKYSIAANQNNDVQVTVARCPFSDPGVQAMVTVIENGIVSKKFSNDAITTFNLIDQETTLNAMIKDYNQLYPDANSQQGLQTVSLRVGSMATAATAERVEQVTRIGIRDDIKTGYTAGGMKYDGHLWIKGMGSRVLQQESQGFLGYKANVSGFAFGGDTQIGYNGLVGIGLSYVNTNLKTKDVPANTLKIMSYQTTFYSSYAPKRYYLDGFLSFAINTYKNTRNIVFADRVAAGTFSSIQPSAKIASGYVCAIGDLSIIPNIYAQYTLLRQSKYSEKGAGDIGLSQISSTDLRDIEGGLGIKFSFLNKEQYELFNPEFHFMVLKNFSMNDPEITSQFIGGGSSFVIKGISLAKITYNAGFGIIYALDDRVTFTANYNLYKKYRFIEHSGMLEIKLAI